MAPTNPTTNLTYTRDFFSTTLSADIGASDLTIYLTAVPVDTEGFLAIDSTDSGNREIIFYNAVGANFVTVPSTDDRGLGGTSAASHLTGDSVEGNLAAEDLEAIRKLQNTPDGSVLARHIATTAIQLGHAEITSDFTSATVGSDVDVTGLAATVTVPSATRRVKVTVYIPSFFSGAAAQSVFRVQLKEGSTILQRWWTVHATNARYPVHLTWSGTTTVGAHTYKATITQDSNAGTMTVEAGATYPATIDVELL